MGNGRLRAMFSMGIGQEHLLMNEITLWMNSKRGFESHQLHCHILLLSSGV